MADPLGLIGAASGIGPLSPLRRPGAVAGEPVQGPGFKQVLQDQIENVNRLQNDAQRALEDLAAGRRDDVESVLIATQKADTAFRLLLQVRNKVMEAYEEVKQIRM